MSYLGLLGSVMAVHLAAVISPGPNFLVITQTSIRDSRYAGLASALGVALASALWAVVALLGVSVLFETATWLYRLLELLGGAYLIYLGVQSWRHAKTPLVSAAAVPPVPQSKWRSFRIGFFTNLTNSKAAVFFGSIFAALLSPALPVWVRGGAVGVVFFNSLWWYTLVALVFSAATIQRGYARVKRYIDRTVGSFLALLGLRLVLSSR